MLDPLVVDHALLLVRGRIPERRPQEEAVELCLRQRERALVLDRVLGREQQERLGHLARDPVDRDLALPHRLEERGLRLRHRPVDLVDEDDVGEDRPRAELEVTRPLVVDGEAGHVRRLQIGRALDATSDGTLDRARDGPGEHGLGRPGNVLEEHVPLAGECGEHEHDLVVLAVHDRLDVGEEALGDPARVRELGARRDWCRCHAVECNRGRKARRPAVSLHRRSG